MERRFADIASSINDLAKHGLVRAANVINDDLIKAIEELDRLETANGNSRLVEAYRGGNSDLEKDIIHASSIRDDVFSNLVADNSMNEDSSVTMNTEERVVDSAMSVITDDDLHREVRRRRSAATRARRNPE